MNVNKEVVGVRRWQVWGVTAAVWLSGVWVCFHQGLYWTDRPGALVLVSAWLIAGAGAAGGWAILLGFRRSTMTHPGLHPGTASLWADLRGESVTRSRYALVLFVGPFVIAAGYGGLLAVGPLSVPSTVEVMLFWTFVGVFGAALGMLATARPLHGRRLLEAGWVLTGGLLAVTALAAVYGGLPLPGAILRTADPAVSAV
ncbi:hypothetical protein [Paenibacillus rubinfantis]|uniref:hypothetical protein n=1 Tax=Paenibacillus rubinfantis TaxID=1720296 RepID=UPI00073E2DCB|nr:hypothetical protein [Paenibacillus rubinfantis]